MGLGRYWKGVKRVAKGAVSGEHSIIREAGDLGKNVYKYAYSPQRSVLYGSNKKGFSVGQGGMSVTHNLAYYGAKVKGDEEQTTYGKRETAAADDAAAQAEAAARKAAHDAEVASLGAGAAESIAKRRRRGLYATVLTGAGPTMGSPGSSSGKTTLGS